jgi:hypothetical protein
MRRVRAHKARIWHQGCAIPVAPGLVGAMGLLMGVWVAVGQTLPSGAAAPKPAEISPMETAWGQMAEVDPGATRGMLMFFSKPTEAIAFLKTRLLPLAISETEVRELIGNLGGADENVWRPAFAQLEYFDPRLAMGLTALMDEVKDQPARGRLVAVLCDIDPKYVPEPRIELKPVAGGYNFEFYGEKKYPSSRWAESQVAKLTDATFIKKMKWTQAERGVLVLQAIGSPEAVAIVKGMATGDARAEPTKVAAKALREMAEEKEAATDDAMESWWGMMASPGISASRATMNFAAHPKEAVGHLKGKLVPLTIERAEVEKLVAELGDDDELVWEPAFERLGYFDPRLVMGVAELWKGANPGVQRERLAAVLMDVKAERFRGKAFDLVSDGPGAKSFNVSNMARGSYGQVVDPVSMVSQYRVKAQWQRAVRAELVLGEIGTAEAVEVLKRMATGNAEAEPTRVAKEELERVGK